MSDTQPQQPDPSAPKSGDQTTPDLTKVNPQIVDAVKVSTRYAFGIDPEILPPGGAGNGAAGAGGGAADPGGPAANAGTPIAYQKAAQALAYSVQDAVDYQRNILSMTSAAEGKALALMFEDIAAEQPEALAEHALVYILSMLGSLAGGLVAEQIANASGEALAKFPKT